RSAKELAAMSKLPVTELSIDLLRADQDDPESLAAAQAHLRLTVKDSSPDNVGKAFTAPAVESALATYPGMFPTAVPTPGTPYGVFWPTTVASSSVETVVEIDGSRLALTEGDPFPPEVAIEPLTAPPIERFPVGGDSQVRVPLGWIAGARSGDKGGNANVGVWIPDPVEIEAVALAAGEVDALVDPLVQTAEDVTQLWKIDDALVVAAEATKRADHSYQWLRTLLDQPESVERLIPEATGLEIQVVALPNLRAVNVVITGLLGKGVSENASLDPQAKGLGEYLRSRQVSFPRDLLDDDALSAT
ncbi:MAG: hypothetical protein CMH41_06115, partial [Micrococcales bacterium]|nr:hypothetical protein [Micrococcales bacterium]